ncbi:CapA family protein [Micromonospora sp. NPDC049679]|uniref:CapA family protein n=1 Tax=Micromonospora sp. NPDC049679 TaxID=3155920 RepID=UPI0033CACC70
MSHAAPHPPRSGQPRRTPAHRPVRALSALLVIALAALGGMTACGGEPAGRAPLWQEAAVDGPGPSPAAAAPAAGAPASGKKAISMSATGDIVMGNVPGKLPANDGQGFFDAVKAALAADLVMGNLEEPLTDDTGTSKCGPKKSDDCHQFRAPPAYAGHLRDAGFMLLNQANNHGNDFGPAGYRNTQKSLADQGLKHTGAPDEITVVEVEGVTVAIAGFSAYAWNNSLVNISAAERVVKRAATMADLVIVQAHMGAEGADKTRVKPGTEMFLGENRGDPVKFSHAVIDAGADLVVGHGPHVLRGMEFYKGRLIAYSLGNFAGGGGTLSNRGPLGLGGVMKVSLTPDGSWAGGEFVSTYMNGAGKPTMDTDDRGLELIRTVGASDFPTTGAQFDDDGKISPPVS